MDLWVHRVYVYVGTVSRPYVPTNLLVVTILVQASCVYTAGTAVDVYSCRAPVHAGCCCNCCWQVPAGADAASCCFWLLHSSSQQQQQKPEAKQQPAASSSQHGHGCCMGMLLLQNRDAWCMACCCFKTGMHGAWHVASAAAALVERGQLPACLKIR